MASYPDPAAMHNNPTALATASMRFVPTTIQSTHMSTQMPARMRALPLPILKHPNYLL